MNKIDPQVEISDDYDGLEKAGKDPTKVHYIMQCDRPGTQLFCVKLEYEHFAPRSGRNKLFDFHIVKWPPDDGFVLMWFIVGIPVGERHLAEQVAQECGLVIKEGVPIMLSATTQHAFPMSGPQVFSLESNPKSKLYNNDPAMYQSMKRGEAAECKRIMDADDQRIRKEFEQQGFTPTQIERILEHWYNGNEKYMEKPQGPPRPASDGQHKHGNIRQDD